MWYDPKIIKYKRSKETGVPSRKDLLKIMEEEPSYTYTAICDYLSEIIRNNKNIDIDSLVSKYYYHPVDVCLDSNYIPSYFFVAYYYYKQSLYPSTAMDFLHIALMDKASYDSASALLALFYVEGFGVKENVGKAKEIIEHAKKEIETWKHRFEIFHLSVFNMDV